MVFGVAVVGGEEGRMSEYTPSTKQVRDGYRYDPEAEYRDPITPHHEINGRAFDRWLASERARIWDEGAQWAAVELGAIGQVENQWVAPSDNPYRTGGDS